MSMIQIGMDTDKVERDITKAYIVKLTDMIAELEKENEWLFDFALGYTNAPFLTECLEALKEKEL
jgi:hypothetical protein